MNAPQLLCDIGRRLIPRPYQGLFEKEVFSVFMLLHADNLLNNPIEQAFIYTCGFMGASVCMMMDGGDIPINDFIRRELKGFVYFCSQQVGLSFYETYGSQLHNFLQALRTTPHQTSKTKHSTPMT